MSTVAFVCMPIANGCKQVLVFLFTLFRSTVSAYLVKGIPWLSVASDTNPTLWATWYEWSLPDVCGLPFCLPDLSLHLVGTSPDIGMRVCLAGTGHITWLVYRFYFFTQVKWFAKQVVCVHVDSVLVSGIKLRQVYSASGICFEVSGLFAGIFFRQMECVFGIYSRQVGCLSGTVEFYAWYLRKVSGYRLVFI